MTEYEYFKTVIEEIDYKVEWERDALCFDESNKEIETQVEKSIAEIIFSQDFMDKYIKHINDRGILEMNTFYESSKFSMSLLGNLDKPAEYLYNTLGLNNK